MIDVDRGQQLHGLACARLSIDEAAFVMGIDLAETMRLAEWYCVQFDPVEVPLAEVEYLIYNSWNHAHVAEKFGCSAEKIAALAKGIRQKRKANAS